MVARRGRHGPLWGRCVRVVDVKASARAIFSRFSRYSSPVVACTPVGGSVEPNPRAARPRAARARSGHSPAAGEIQEKVRGRHQPRPRAERCRSGRAVALVPGPRAAVDRNAAASCSASVEVETAESVNHLEAMSQWAAFSRLRAPFHLYVPASSIDTARRLCADLQIPVGRDLGLQRARRSDALHAGAAVGVGAERPRAEGRAGRGQPRPAPGGRARAPSRPGRATARRAAAAAGAARRKAAAKTEPRTRRRRRRGRRRPDPSRTQKRK